MHQGLVHRLPSRRCFWTDVLEVIHFAHLVVDYKLLRHASLIALSCNYCIVHFLHGGLVLVFASPPFVSSNLIFPCLFLQLLHITLPLFISLPCILIELS